MKNVFGAIVTAAALTFAGAAHAELMDSTFGNTVTIASGGAVVVSYYFDGDGSVSLAAADGTEAAGTWALDGTSLCVTIGEDTSCSEIEDRGVGESWDETDEEGNTVTISIVEGR